MNNPYKKCIAGMALAIVANTSWAHEVYLRAEQFSQLLPGGVSTVMWGYSECTTADFLSCSAPSSPGPAIEVPVGDSLLNITLSNTLPVTTSLYIPSLSKPLSPRFATVDAGNVITDDGATSTASNRVISFDTEVSTGGAVATYSWVAVTPGTYVYQSGTHIQRQVHMGLYGVVSQVADCAGTPCAYTGNNTDVRTYNDDATFDVAATITFSEIDDTLHPASIGIDASSVNATIDGYLPSYFLVNGASADASTAAQVLATVAVGETLLLRVVNASLRSISPQLIGGYFSIVGEDGNRVPVKKEQHTLLLPAQKTFDLLFNPVLAGDYVFYDRRMNLVSPDGSRTGMLGVITVTGS